MENKNESNKNVVESESQSLILRVDDEHVKQSSQQQNNHTDQRYGDEVNNQIYKNTINFTAALPQVNRKIVIRRLILKLASSHVKIMCSID